MAQVILAVGSNMGNPKENLDRAIKALSAVGTVGEVAPYIISKPEGYSQQADFVNTVLILQTQEPPMELLKKLKALEKELGTPIKVSGIQQLNGAYGAAIYGFGKVK